jgi:hypothetical protein
MEKWDGRPKLAGSVSAHPARANQLHGRQSDRQRALAPVWLHFRFAGKKAHRWSRVASSLWTIGGSTASAEAKALANRPAQRSADQHAHSPT